MLTSSRQRRSGAPLALCALLGATSCSAGSAADFMSGRGLDPCIQALPACPGLRAECVLDDTRYTERTFPGDFRFLVRAEPDSKIEIDLYLTQQRDAGLTTRIDWNEPGCADVYTYDSGGRDLFAEAADTSIISKKQTIREGGEHLIEIQSDMQAKVLVGVRVFLPNTE